MKRAGGSAGGKVAVAATQEQDGGGRLALLGEGSGGDDRAALVRRPDAVVVVRRSDQQVSQGHQGATNLGQQPAEGNQFLPVKNGLGERLGDPVDDLDGVVELLHRTLVGGRHGQRHRAAPSLLGQHPAGHGANRRGFGATARLRTARCSRVTARPVCRGSCLRRPHLVGGPIRFHILYKDLPAVIELRFRIRPGRSALGF